MGEDCFSDFVRASLKTGVFYADHDDKKFMARALELAAKGMGHTRPNPMVGAVLVKDGEIIGEGWHEFYGGPHAEVNAFADCRADPAGATLYVTLEPCCHYGKTPPCADLIASKNLERVVVAMQDPNPLVSGKGIRKLKDAGIFVTTGVMEKEAQVLNEVFMKFITEKKPFVLYKSAVSMDGKRHAIRESRSGFHRKNQEKKFVRCAVCTRLSWQGRERLPQMILCLRHGRRDWKILSASSQTANYPSPWSLVFSAAIHG